MGDDSTNNQPAGPAQRHTRRLSDKIVIAFHQACDQGDLDVAERLLTVLAMVVTRPATVPNRRHDTDSLVAAHERLWNLRHLLIDEC